MAKQPNRRPQSPKGRSFTRVMRVQDIRRSNASGFHGSDKYDRNGFRNLAQAGRWDDLEDTAY